MIGMDRDVSVANDCQRIGQRMWGWGVRDVEGHLARLSLEDPVYIAKQLNSQPLIFFWLNLIRLGTHMAIHKLHKRAGRANMCVRASETFYGRKQDGSLVGGLTVTKCASNVLPHTPIQMFCSKYSRYSTEHEWFFMNCTF